MYAERAYFDGDHCQHCVDREDAQRLERIRRDGAAAMRRASISDLHYQLGKLVEHGPGFVLREGGGRIDTNRRHFGNIERIGRPVNVSDATQFPNIARARAELAAMPAARRERLEQEWRA